MAFGIKNRRKIIESVASVDVFCVGTVRGAWYPQDARLSTGKLDPDDHQALTEALAAGITYVVWSYDTPIAWRTAHGAWVMPEAGYSNTTRHHKALVRQGMRSWDERCQQAAESVFMFCRMP